MKLSVDVKDYIDPPDQLPDTIVNRVERKVVTKFINKLNAEISRKLSEKYNVYITGLRRVRFKKSRVRGLFSRAKSSGKLWIGENDIHARYKKGRWKQHREGASKGSFFKKGSFIIKTKQGKMLFLERVNGKMRHVKFQLANVEIEVAHLVKTNEPYIEEYINALLAQELERNAIN